MLLIYFFSGKVSHVWEQIVQISSLLSEGVCQDLGNFDMFVCFYGWVWTRDGLIVGYS